MTYGIQMSGSNSSNDAGSNHTSPSSVNKRDDQVEADTMGIDIIAFNGQTEDQEIGKKQIKDYSKPNSTLLTSLPALRSNGLENLQTPKRTCSESSIAVNTPRQWYSSMTGRRKSFKPVEPPSYTIEYSVFKPVEYFQPITDELDFQKHLIEIMKTEGCIIENGDIPENSMNPSDFNHMVSVMTRDVQYDSELKPVQISHGSSGSYFILGKEWNEGSDSERPSFKIFTRGIFKPKDEEPYGPLSPKWTKWLHRTFFPCFFGRSCLIPNLGYISEAAACVLDRQLLSYIVPYTDVIYLKSSQFYYPFWERGSAKHGRYKIGSFQMFLKDYMEAQDFLKLYPIPQDLDTLPQDRDFFVDGDNPFGSASLRFQWTKKILGQFQEQLEKLVILDYIMRNTDRGLDNWMIKLEWRECKPKENRKRMEPYLKIGAIDSGLAFPWKHPNEWRSFPFGWLFLPYSIIGQPFSRKTREHYLPLLTSKYWWEQTVSMLKEVFMKDEDFKERMWLKQVAVLKGQAFNVVEILKLHYAGPLELTRRENLMIWDDIMYVPILKRNENIGDRRNNHVDQDDRDTGQTSNTEFTENTPLLHHQTSPKRMRSTSMESIGYRPMHMSGFEFNLNYTDEERHRNYADDETNTKKVIIERLEKVYSRPPVFTWC